jgi:hypothetical protein
MKRLARKPASILNRASSPVEAGKVCHGVLQQTGIRRRRALQQDLLPTTNQMSYR